MNRKLLLHITMLLSFLVNSYAQEKVTYDNAFPNLTFQYPVEIQNASDGSDRLFVVEQQGVVRVFKNTGTATNSEVFLDITDMVSFSAGQEIGLLGLAFHPDFKANGVFFVYHTKRSTIANVGVEIVLAKYTVDENNINRANKSSRVEIFSFDKNQSTSNHNGGKIAFGPDGYLYISVGDGGGGGDPMRNAQNLNTIFGSILRIDIDLDDSNPLEKNPDLPNGNYEIPRDNPRVGLSGLDELYAWGIRNTWKFSFDDDILWGADVGQDRAEEINHIVKGGNYGWSRMEGSSTYNSSVGLLSNPDIKPIFEYDHSAGDLSITGGYVYNGTSSNTLLQGKYIYADYVSGRVWSLNYDSTTNNATSTLLFRTNGDYVSSFGLDEAGEMYFSGYGTAAKIFKISGGQEQSLPVPNKTDGVGYWNEIANGTDGVVNCMVQSGDDIYIGGLFSQAGNKPASNFAVYNKITGWKTPLGQVNGEVNTIAVTAAQDIIIGGSFSQVNGILANNIAQFNGTEWKTIGSGTNGSIDIIAVDADDNYYVGGAFTNAGDQLVNNIAFWNNGWKALKEPTSITPGLNNEVREIVISENGTLYIGGNFDAAGNKSTPRIATWNGTSWGTLGTGTSGFVEAVALDADYVYVGGNFNLASGKTVNRISRWNILSSQWETLGNGLSGNVNAIAVDNENVYVAGNFVFASNAVSYSLIVNNIARWNIVDGWQPLGEELQVGTNNRINSILLDTANNSLLVAGNFSAAGGVNSNYFAQWSENYLCATNEVIQEYQINGIWSSGEEALELNEGTQLVLSILPNGEKFTIALPNGSVVNGDYSLGEITKEMEGLYTFTTENGCEASLDIKVISNIDCDSITIVPEFIIGEESWRSVTNDELIVKEGSIISLRLTENFEEYTITTPSGLVTNGAIILKEASAGNYTFTTVEGCSKVVALRYCDNTSVIPEFKISTGDWIKGENKIVIDEGSAISFGLPTTGENYKIITPNKGSVDGILNLTDVTKEDEGEYLFEISTGCTSIFNLEIISFSTDDCPVFIANENEGLQIPVGEFNQGSLVVEGNSEDTFNSACAMKITTLGNGGRWDKYAIELNLVDLGIKAGDILSFSIDAKGLDGTARIEVVENNRPNTWEIGKTFTKEWSTFTQQITVPDVVSTLNIWLFSNYGSALPGASIYDNLKIEKLNEEVVVECESSFADLNESILLENEVIVAGLDNLKGFYSDLPQIGCAIELTNTDQNQPWARYKTSLDLEKNGLGAGDILTIAIDGKTILGNARIEVVYNDRPNTWDLGHTFTQEWSNYSQDIVIPLNTKTIDIWLFTNYNRASSAGIAQFANLIIEKQTLQSVAPLKVNFGSVESNEIATDIVIFPNPTADLITVDVSKYTSQEIGVLILSSNNSVVLEQSFDADHGDFISLDMSQFQKGIYIVTLKTSNGDSMAKKVIKK